jgi:hypothetical protein
MSAQTTGSVSTRGKGTTLVLLCFLTGYGVAAIKQAVIGTPWPKAVRVEATKSRVQPRPPAREAVVEHDCAEKRVEKLL